MGLVWCNVRQQAATLKWVVVQILVAAPPTMLPVNTPGKEQEGGPMLGPLSPTCMEFLILTWFEALPICSSLEE